MRISTDRLKQLCREHGTTLAAVLRDTGVSRNAFYSLARKSSVLPKSITALADALGVRPVEFMIDEGAPLERAKALLKDVERVKQVYPETDDENTRHTLLLLREKPVDRLRRALTRAQRFDFRPEGS